MDGRLIARWGHGRAAEPQSAALDRSPDAVYLAWLDLRPGRAQVRREREPLSATAGVAGCDRWCGQPDEPVPVRHGVLPCECAERATGMLARASDDRARHERATGSGDQGPGRS